MTAGSSFCRTALIGANGSTLMPAFSRTAAPGLPASRASACPTRPGSEEDSTAPSVVRISIATIPFCRAIRLRNVGGM